MTIKQNRKKEKHLKKKSEKKKKRMSRSLRNVQIRDELSVLLETANLVQNKKVTNCSHGLFDNGKLNIPFDNTNLLETFIQTYQKVTLDEDVLNKRRVQVDWCFNELNGIIAAEDAPNGKDKCSIYLDVDGMVKVTKKLGAIIDRYQDQKEMRKKIGLVFQTEGSCHLEKTILGIFPEDDHDFKGIYSLSSKLVDYSQFDLQNSHTKESCSISRDEITVAMGEVWGWNNTQKCSEKEFELLSKIYHLFISQVIKNLILPTFILFHETILRSFDSSNLRDVQYDENTWGFMHLDTQEKKMNYLMQKISNYEYNFRFSSLSITDRVINVPNPSTIAMDFRCYKLGWHLIAPKIVHFNDHNLKFREEFVDLLSIHSSTSNFCNEQTPLIIWDHPDLHCQLIPTHWNDMIDFQVCAPGKGLRLIYSYKCEPCPLLEKGKKCADSCSICKGTKLKLKPHVYIPFGQIESKSVLEHQMTIYGNLIKKENRKGIDFRNFSIINGYLKQQVVFHSPLYNNKLNLKCMEHFQFKTPTSIDSSFPLQRLLPFETQTKSNAVLIVAPSMQSPSRSSPSTTSKVSAQRMCHLLDSKMYTSQSPVIKIHRYHVTAINIINNMIRNCEANLPSGLHYAMQKIHGWSSFNMTNIAVTFNSHNQMQLIINGDCTYCLLKSEGAIKNENFGSHGGSKIYFSLASPNGFNENQYDFTQRCYCKKLFPQYKHFVTKNSTVCSELNLPHNRIALYCPTEIAIEIFKSVTAALLKMTSQFQSGQLDYYKKILFYSSDFDLQFYLEKAKKESKLDLAYKYVPSSLKNDKMFLAMKQMNQLPTFSSQSIQSIEQQLFQSEKMLEELSDMTKKSSTDLPMAIQGKKRLKKNDGGSMPAIQAKRIYNYANKLKEKNLLSWIEDQSSKSSIS